MTMKSVYIVYITNCFLWTMSDNKTHRIVSYRIVSYSLISLNIPGIIYIIGIKTLLSSVGKSLQFSAANARYKCVFYAHYCCLDRDSLE